MRIIIIQPYPNGTAPGQRFRYEQYLSFLISNNFSITIKSFIGFEGWNIYHQKGHLVKKVLTIMYGFFKRWLLMFSLYKYDVIFIYREASPLGPPVFEWIVAKILRRKYIYDFDDAIWLANYSETNAKFQRLKAYWKVNYCMKWASHVTAGNDYLASYARQYNPSVSIIPTTIDTVNHHNKMCDQGQDEMVIGWTGTHTTMHYLNELIPVLQELEKTHAFTFLVISNEAPNFQLKSLQFIKWNKETEIEDLAKMNIGVMPLNYDIWSEGKCGFKGLQYMSLEIATVMSPVGVNTSIVEDGVNGFLAGNKDDWKEKLRSLLENKELRMRLGKAGKQTIEERFSVNALKPAYLNLFRD